MDEVGIATPPYKWVFISARRLETYFYERRLRTRLVNQILQASIYAGAKIAQAGEFSKRAFLNGKIDLVQAEAIADMISSTSNRSAKLALNSLRGEFYNLLVFEL